MKRFFKSWLSCTLVSSALVSTIGVGSLTGLALYEHQKEQAKQEEIRQREKNRISNYVKTNLSDMIEEQEKKLNISHFGIPTVKAGIPQTHKDAHPGIPICGSYGFESNIIYLKKNIFIDNEEVDRDGLETKTSTNSCKIKETLDHELSHYYTDKFNESLGQGDWPSYDYENQSVDERMALTLISEGIAEYSERTMNVRYDHFDDKEFPKLSAGFWYDQEKKIPNYHLRYNGGYHLVKPIIDQFRMSGIHYLVQNPPNAEEALDLPKYRQNVLNTLWGKVDR